MSHSKIKSEIHGRRANPWPIFPKNDLTKSTSVTLTPSVEAKSIEFTSHSTWCLHLKTSVGLNFIVNSQHVFIATPCCECRIELRSVAGQDELRCSNCCKILTFTDSPVCRTAFEGTDESREQFIGWLKFWFSTTSLDFLQSQLCAVALEMWIDEFNIPAYISALQLAHISGNRKAKLNCDWKLLRSRAILLF